MQIPKLIVVPKPAVAAVACAAATINAAVAPPEIGIEVKAIAVPTP